LSHIQIDTVRFVLQKYKQVRDGNDTGRQKSKPVPSVHGKLFQNVLEPGQSHLKIKLSCHILSFVGQIKYSTAFIFGNFSTVLIESYTDR
jgi:hypothetical protein